MNDNKNLFISIKSFINNKITRVIYKYIYKYTHAKNYRHNRRYWPYYKVERNDLGSIKKVYFKKQMIVDNTIPVSKNASKCMLIATGPSIKDLSFEKLDKNTIDFIGVNGAINLEGVFFKYYIIIDHNFTTKRFDLVKKVLNTNCTLYTTAKCLDIILRKINFSEIICSIKLMELITEGKIERFLGKKEIVDQTKNYFFIKNDRGFSKNISNTVFDYFTVAYIALQVINDLNYKEVYLAGLDMNNFAKPRFYENNENKQPTMLDQYLKDSLPAFDTAAYFFKNNDIKVYNLSPQSAVTSFQKLDLTCLENNI